MAEINTVIAEASQDLQTIEDFVNLPAGSDVRPRLLPSVNVGTLAGTRDAIFEAGGLPATPFATKALMTASALADGKYAMVTNDTTNNGLYVKTAGTWVKSAYDPLEQAKADAATKSDNAVAVSKSYTDSIFNNEPIIVAIKPIFGEAINATSPETSVFLTPNPARAYIKLDVTAILSITVSNSIADLSWKWVFRDASDAYISTSTATAVNGTFAVPTGAVWAYRTYQIGDKGAYESPDLSITAETKYKVKKVVDEAIASSSILPDAKLYTDKLLYGSNVIDIAINPIAGFAVEASDAVSSILTPQRADDVREYITFDVSDLKSITVSNAITTSTWKWVFSDISGNKISSTYTANGTFLVPDIAVKAYRTIYYKRPDGAIFDDITSGMTIKGTYKRQRIQPQIDSLDTRVDELSLNSNEIAKMQVNIDKMESMFKDNNFISPNDFADATQMGRIKSAVAFAKLQGYGIIELATDTVLSTDIWTLTEAVLLPSNCWIYINNSTVKKAAGVFDNIFRNEGIVPNPDPFKFALALNENTNIRIFGNDKTLSKIEGNFDAPYTAPHPINGGEAVPWIQDVYGWRAISILFANTKGHRVHDLTISKVTAWSISNEHGCRHYKYHDLIFDTVVLNGDGINSRMGCSDYEIYNISGHTADDMIANTALNGFHLTLPTGRYIYPTQVGGYIDRGHGVDIRNGKIWNISSTNSRGGILVLATGGSKIENISINNIDDKGGASALYLVLVLSTGSYGSAAAMGDIKNITINNVKSYFSNTVIRLEAPIQDSWINNIQQDKASAVDAVAYGAGYSATNIKVTNVKQVPTTP